MRIYAICLNEKRKSLFWDDRFLGLKEQAMNKEAKVLIAEDDDGHFTLIQRNLLRAGISNETFRFQDGQELIDYLEALKGSVSHLRKSYLLLLDLRMPKVSGLEVLRMIKEDPVLRRIPVIVLSTASTEEEIDRCHELGCCMYIVKPVEYSSFVEMIRRIGSFLSILELPFLQPVDVHSP